MKVFNKILSMYRNKEQQQHGGGIYQKIVNRFTNSKLRPSELHPVMYTKKGFRAGNYLGPGTDVVHRVKEGVEPISTVDRTAQAHDLRYGLAKNRSDVRNADKRMISVLNRLGKEKSDYMVNRAQGHIGIRGKMFAEDFLGVKPETIASFGGISDEDRPAMQAKLNELEQAGYGLKTCSECSNNTWMQHVASVRQKNKNMSYKQCLKLASKTYKAS